MDSEEVKIVVETCKYGSDFVSVEIAARWSKFVRPSLHHLTKGGSFQSQADCSHLCDCVTAIQHVISPCFNSLLKLREISWHSILSDVFHYVSYVVEVSPFCVQWRRLRSLSCILLRVVIDDFSMLSGLLGILGSGSNLEIIFWEDIRNWSASVELFRSFVKEALHEVQKLVVLFCIDSGIFDDETSIGLKCFCHSFTVLRVVSRPSEEALDIYDGNRERGTEKPSDSIEFEHRVLINLQRNNKQFIQDDQNIQAEQTINRSEPLLCKPREIML